MNASLADRGLVTLEPAVWILCDKRLLTAAAAGDLRLLPDFERFLSLLLADLALAAAPVSRGRSFGCTVLNGASPMPRLIPAVGDSEDRLLHDSVNIKQTDSST